MITITNIQRNPNTGRALYNPSTGKLIGRPSYTAELKLTLSDFIACPCTKRTCLGSSWGADWDGGTLAAALNGLIIYKPTAAPYPYVIYKKFGYTLEYSSCDGTCKEPAYEWGCYPLTIWTNTTGNQTHVKIAIRQGAALWYVFEATCTHGIPQANTYPGCSNYNPLYGYPGEPCLLEYPCGSSGMVLVEVV